MKDYKLIQGFIESLRFHKRWFGLRFTEDNYIEPQMVLLENPKIGSVMQGIGGLRKMRYAFEGRGKSGSVRVLYVDFEIHERILLLNVFVKDEKENLTKEERNQI